MTLFTRPKPLNALIIAPGSITLIKGILKNSFFCVHRYYHEEASWMLDDLQLYNRTGLVTLITTHISKQERINTPFIIAFETAPALLEITTPLVESVNVTPYAWDAFQLTIDPSLFYVTGIKRELLLQYQLLIHACALKKAHITTVTMVQLVSALHNRFSIASPLDFPALKEQLAPYGSINYVLQGLTLMEGQSV